MNDRDNNPKEETLKESLQFLAVILGLILAVPALILLHNILNSFWNLFGMGF